MDKIINFNRVNEPFGEFSNFAPYQININGVVWPTSEHYFQAQKSEDPFYRKAILKADTPKKAAVIGRNPDLKIRRDWDQLRIRVMHKVVYAKFTQHPDLKELLLSTGDALLVEHSRRDSYWGDGGDGSGENMLGKTLMRIREELRR